MDNIDRDLFGRNVRGAMYQPVDETLDKYKKASYNLVRAAYAENVVRAPCLSCTSLEACNRLRACLSRRARQQIHLPPVMLDDCCEPEAKVAFATDVLS